MHQKGRQAQVSLYLPPQTLEQLKGLSDRTRVPLAAYFREAVDDLLEKHGVARKPAGKARRGSK